ncbi:hypothetical protein CYMTET_49845 [Cymbomonas tetramitiformis]|uniref:Uncharacterized protein n=1 Tax=Cymbomonas tetramitiformis TaxID=36881 RepID=A0AAE0ETH0_9CHLO|nr:hypothetical protein CYMTET_49845 [Cymbomonas tetramitiformis]
MEIDFFSSSGLGRLPSVTQAVFPGYLRAVTQAVFPGFLRAVTQAVFTGYLRAVTQAVFPGYLRAVTQALLMHFALKYDTVAFIGFDFGTGSHQHYWETKQKNETCHNMLGEAKVIEKMVSEGLLYRLGKAPKIEADDSFDTYDPNCKIVCYTDGGCKKLTGQAFLSYMKNPLAWEDKHGMRSLGKRVDSKMYAKEKRKFHNKRKRNGR